jgi:hypothetical protein
VLKRISLIPETGVSGESGQMRNAVEVYINPSVGKGSFLAGFRIDAVKTEFSAENAVIP